MDNAIVDRKSDTSPKAGYPQPVHSDQKTGSDLEKMKIRLVLRKQEATTEPLVTHYEYHYDRIALLVVCVLFLLFGAVWFLLPHQSSSDIKASMKTSSNSAISDSGVISDEDDLRGIDGQHESAPANEMTALNNSFTRSGTNSNLLQENSDEALLSNSASNSKEPVDGAKTKALSGSLQRNSQSLTSQVSESIPIGPSAVSKDSVKGNSVLSAPSVQFNPQSVERAELAWRVDDLEPSQTINEHLVFSGDESVKRVFFFTQVNDKKDQYMFYKWFYNDKLAATVKVGIWGNRWRSYSSKQIFRKQPGVWSVYLENQQGVRMASATFNVIVKD